MFRGTYFPKVKHQIFETIKRFKVLNGKYILERYERDEAENLKKHVSEGNTVQDSGTPVVVVFEFILVLFLGSNDVAMPGETTAPTEFPATLPGVTIAHKALSGAAFTSLAETGLAGVSILPSHSVHIEIEETKTSKHEFRWIAQLLPLPQKFANKQSFKARDNVLLHQYVHKLVI